MADAIKKVAGTEYNVANSAGGLCKCIFDHKMWWLKIRLLELLMTGRKAWESNSAIQWSYHRKITSRHPESSLNGQYFSFGFQLPEKFINQVCEEVFAGLEVLAQHVSRQPVLHRRQNRLNMRGWPLNDLNDLNMNWINMQCYALFSTANYSSEFFIGETSIHYHFLYSTLIFIPPQHPSAIFTDIDLTLFYWRVLFRWHCMRTGHLRRSCFRWKPTLSMRTSC